MKLPEFDLGLYVMNTLCFGIMLLVGILALILIIFLVSALWPLALLCIGCSALYMLIVWLMGDLK